MCTSFGLHGLCSLPSLPWSLTACMSLTHFCVRPLVSMVSCSLSLISVYVLWSPWSPVVSHSFMCTCFGLQGLCSLPSLLQSLTHLCVRPLVSMVSVVSPVCCSLSLSLTHLCVRPLVSMVSVVSPVSHGLSLHVSHSFLCTSFGLHGLL